jgi:hypothetical protein
MRKVVTIDQSRKPEIAPCFVTLGSYRFENGGQAYVLLSTGDTDGHVTADAVQFLPQGQADSFVNTKMKANASEVEGTKSNTKESKRI